MYGISFSDGSRYIEDKKLGKWRNKRTSICPLSYPCTTTRSLSNMPFCCLY